MSLQEICEPLFLEVCRLNRAARAGEALAARRVRESLAAHLADARARAALDPLAAEQFARVEPAIIICLDLLVSGGGWACAASWHVHGVTTDQRADAARVFTLADEAIRERSPGARERLAVFHSCLAFGLVGGPFSEPALERLATIDLILGGGRPPGTNVCPDAYAPVCTTDLTRSPRHAIGAVALVALGLLAALLAVNLDLSRQGAQRLRNSLERVATSTLPERAP